MYWTQELGYLGAQIAVLSFRVSHWSHGGLLSPFFCTDLLHPFSVLFSLCFTFPVRVSHSFKWPHILSSQWIQTKELLCPRAPFPGRACDWSSQVRWLLLGPVSCDWAGSGWPYPASLKPGYLWEWKGVTTNTYTGTIGAKQNGPGMLQCVFTLDVGHWASGTYPYGQGGIPQRGGHCWRARTLSKMAKCQVK